MGNTPSIIRDRLRKTILFAGLLLLVTIIFLVQGERGNAIVATLLAAVLFLNMADLVIQYQKGKLLVYRGTCVKIERERPRFGRETVSYRVELQELLEHGAKGELQTIYLNRSKKLTLREKETYEFLFRDKEDLDDYALYTYKRISNQRE